MSSHRSYRLQHTAALKEVKALTKRSKGRFDAYLGWCERDERCERFNLSDLLVKPLQRITRYPLLLKAIHKGCSADSVESARLAQCISQLDSALEAHNSILQENENNIKLERVQDNLLWPTLAEASPKEFIPEILHKHFARRHKINLAVDPHFLDTASGDRRFMHEGSLHVINHRKARSETLFAYLFGSILFLTKPVTSDKRLNKTKGSVYAEKAPKLAYQRALHLQEVQVTDVPDSPGLKNCFVLEFLDGFGRPYEHKTVAVATRFEKDDWLRHLGDGIRKSNTTKVLARTDSDTSRKTRMAPSRGPLRASRHNSGTPTPRNTSNDEEASAGFWGLDSLASAKRSASVDNLAPSSSRKKGSKRKLPERPRLTRSTSLPKTQAADDFMWDNLGTFDAGGSLGSSIGSTHSLSADSLTSSFTDLGTLLDPVFPLTQRPSSTPPIATSDAPEAMFGTPHSNSRDSEFISVVDQSWLSEPAVNR